MIRVIYENAPEHNYESLEEATEDICDKVLSEGDIVFEVRDLKTDKEYGCNWSLKLEEIEDAPQ